MLPSLIDVPEAVLPLTERVSHIQSLLEILVQEQGLSREECQVWLQGCAKDLERVVVASDYVYEQLTRQPVFLATWVKTAGGLGSITAEALRADLAARLSLCETEVQLTQSLRQFRQYHQVRIIWRDLTRKADLAETCRDLSHLADACIDLAYHWLYAKASAQYGVPMGQASGLPQHLVVLGMGKLGGYELNLSSDIDLIFAYPESGTCTGERALDNQTFFIRLGQKLIKALDAITLDGFVFRVDMRLRPYGASGALVFSFAALELYYQEQGRDWERYAMIKARAVAGDLEAGQHLLALLRPFVYRRYLDFSAIKSLRAMKQLIAQEVKRKGMAENIKLGEGGIREVEFIAQMFQLIHGGRDIRLQQRALMEILTVLDSGGYLPATTVLELREGYRFLRYVEHALQAIADRQTQLLPDDPQDQARVAFMLGFANWPEFLHALNHWRDIINGHFQRVIAEPEEEAPRGDAAPCTQKEGASACWVGDWCEAEAQVQLQALGFQEPQTAAQRLGALHQGALLRSMQALGRERLDAFIPRLLIRLSACGAPDLVLERVLPLIESIARRSAYLVLLTENPDALDRLLSLCRASPWIAEQVTRFPVLLDELLNAGRLYAPPAQPELVTELRERLMRVPEDDLEQQMEVLRHFKLAHSLRVAASEVAETLPLMKVSDYLTWLAEAILEQVLALAWRHTVARHGQPRRKDGALCDPDFVILGYGKLGGIELGHGSDLDLVFIHDGDPNQETDGLKPIDGAQFFMRLGQRIIHLLTTQTASGQLYEVDMRLRPSGASGLLVSTLTSYEHYQMHEAWTWEHQALVRARPVAGCPRLAEHFRSIRQSILGRERDLSTLRQEVSEMRAKMREALGTKATAAGTDPKAFDAHSCFHLKHDAGGIVDIEFMVQYATLAWSHQHPELLHHTDNIRILDGLKQTHWLPCAQVELLQDAYKAYRTAAHRLALQRQPGVVGGDRFHDERQTVIRIWRELGLS